MLTWHSCDEWLFVSAFCWDRNDYFYEQIVNIFNLIVPAMYQSSVPSLH